MISASVCSAAGEGRCGTLKNRDVAPSGASTAPRGALSLPNHDQPPASPLLESPWTVDPSPSRDLDLLRRTFGTHVFGVVAVTNAFLPALGRSAPGIVNISSGTGSLAWSTGSNSQFDYRATGNGAAASYRSSKTALNALTISYAQALATEGVNVNALAPGLRATNLNPTWTASDDGPTGSLFGEGGDWAVLLCPI